MGTRHEKVVLSIEDGLTPGLGRAAAAAALLDHNLEELDGTSIRTSRSMRSANQSVEAFSTSTRRSAPDLNQYTGRLAAMATAAVTLGPALIPLGAAAVPVVTTLAAGMGAAAGAAGVLSLAFAGVGEAVEAVSTYKLEPTAQNLARVQQAMDELGPSGAQFVLTLDEMAPALDELQRAAGDGIFPGFDRGLRELRTELPGVRALVEDLSSTVGELGEASADSLANDDDWAEFFDLIGTEGASSLDSFGRATGNFVAGVANLLEALSGISGNQDDLVANARAFREWADELEHTEGFQEFADTVRESGPQVADFLVATGEAMVALIQAAAPWGNVVLPALTTTAELFTALAGSPIGPPLFTAAAAMLAFSKASALVGPRVTQATTAMVGARTGLKQLNADLKTVAGGWVLASSASEREAAAMGAASDRIKGHLASIGKGAAIIGSAGLLASGAADKMGVTNAVMLGMAGSMAGPWGAAAGAAVGLTLDLAHANDDLKSAIEDANAAMSSGQLAEMGAAIKQLRADIRETTDDDIWGIDLGDGFGGRVSEIAGIVAPLTNAKRYMGELTGETDKAREKLEQLKAAKAGLEDLAVALGANRDSAAEMSTGVDRAQYAMEKLGISNADLAAAQRAGGVEFDLLSGRIQTFLEYTDSAPGRTQAVADAVSNLGEDALGAANSAQELSAALDALTSPEQNLIATQDALTKSIRHLSEDLDAQNKTLVGNSDAAIQNRAAISGRVDDLKAMIAAEAEAGRGPEVVARSLSKQRQALIESAVAAGANRRQVEALVNQMNLTPELVKTVFESAGIDVNQQKARNLYDAYTRLPKGVRTDIKANGIPKSEADIARLQRKYKLTPAQVRTIAALKNEASPQIAAVLRDLINLDGKTANTTITTTHVMRTVEQTAAINRERARGGFQENGRLAFADGGYGIDGRYYSRRPMLVSGGANILWGEKETGWEAYISGKPGERDRNLQILSMAADRLGAHVTAFASGGMTGRRDPVAATLWQSGHRTPDASLLANMVVPQLDRLGRAFDDLSSRRLTRLGRALEKATTLQEKQTEKARTAFEAVRDRRNQLGSSITDGLRGDLWSDTGASAFGKEFASGSIGAVNAQLRAERDQARQFSKDIATLRRKGVNGAALEEIIASGDADRARMFASGSTSALRSYEAAFNARQSATAAAGRLGGQVLTPEFSALRHQLNQQLAQQQAMNRQLAALRKEQKQQHDAAQKSRKDNGAGPAAKRGASGRR